jgi:hypothetical protein
MNNHSHPAELFNELESFNVQEQECAKQKFAEAFASSEYKKVTNKKYTFSFFLIFYFIFDFCVKIGEKN